MPSVRAVGDELVVEPLRPQPLGDGRTAGIPVGARPGAGPVPVGHVRQGDDDPAALRVGVAQLVLVDVRVRRRRPRSARRAAGTTRTSSASRTASPRGSGRRARRPARSGRTRCRFGAQPVHALAVAPVDSVGDPLGTAACAAGSGQQPDEPPAGQVAERGRLVGRRGRRHGEAPRSRPRAAARGHQAVLVAWSRTSSIRCTTVTVLATASTPSDRDQQEQRRRCPDSPVITSTATSRSERSAMPPLACMPRHSALARAYDVTEPITRQHIATPAAAGRRRPTSRTRVRRRSRRHRAGRASSRGRRPTSRRRRIVRAM